jgi:ABC-type multidrug transport system permease subunit
MRAFSLQRLAAVFIKEFQQMLRDRLTFAMAIGVPILQLVLFGHAINTDPKGLPTVIVAADAGPMTRSLSAALQNTGYFKVVKTATSEHEAAGYVESGDAPFEWRIHRRYNPEGLARYNIVPGLIGTILTMTMVMLTGLAMTRERERGTMENLLATPVRPFEVMVGKIATYVVIGYVQLLVILAAAALLFEVPMEGSISLLLVMIGVFMIANLAVGFTFSTLAKNQLQAMQMTFFFLPSMLLSGFMFPFRGMPEWAQMLGEVLPLTHFLRIVRGIMLKGHDAAAVLPELWPLVAFLLAAGAIALKRYRQTLD